MTIKYTFYFFLILLILPLATTFAQDTDESDIAGSENGTLITCGVERWAVKTCYDADTVNVNFSNIVPTTITYQRSITKPTLPVITPQGYLVRIQSFHSTAI